MLPGQATLLLPPNWSLCSHPILSTVSSPDFGHSDPFKIQVDSVNTLKIVNTAKNHQRMLKPPGNSLLGELDIYTDSKLSLPEKRRTFTSGKI